MSHQMLDSLEGYIENIAAEATQTMATCGPLPELAASLTVSVDTVARQQIEIKRLAEQINALRKKGGAVTSGVTGTGGNNSNSPNCKRYAAVGRLSPHRNNKCYFYPHKNKERMGWATKLMEAKGIIFNDE